MMELRLADCGHYIAAEAEPVGTEHNQGHQLYLCAACAAVARDSVRQRVETKAASPPPLPHPEPPRTPSATERQLGEESAAEAPPQPQRAPQRVQTAARPRPSARKRSR